MSIKITGKLPSGNLLKRLQQSPNYKNGAFQNISETPMKQPDVSYWKMTKEMMKKHPQTEPPSRLPFVKTDLKNLNSPEPLIVWFGHSSYLIRIENKNFLIDPVFSGNAAPVSFMVKAFPGADEYKAEDMPAVDYLILTHDHYDHLDFKTLLKLKNKVSTIYCSLGVSSHLKYWGFDENKINELDWWQSKQIDQNIQLTAAPARHFSGRGLKRGQTFWSSFILKTATHNLYLGGDSGYDAHFKEIGEKFGPFDLAILESGQYNTMWPLIHMIPEQTVQAAIDLKAKALLPVHWAKFKLGMHPWNEPVKRVVAEVERTNRLYKEQGTGDKVQVVTPKIGEPLLINGDYKTESWWNLL